MIRQMAGGSGFLQKDKKKICCEGANKACKYVFTGLVDNPEEGPKQLTENFTHVKVLEYLGEGIDGKEHILPLDTYTTFHEFRLAFYKAIYMAGYAPENTDSPCIRDNEGDLEIIGELEVLALMVDDAETAPAEVLCNQISVCQYAVVFMSETDPIVVLNDTPTTVTGTFDATVDTDPAALEAALAAIPDVIKAKAEIKSGTAYTASIWVSGGAPTWNGERMDLCGCEADFEAEEEEEVLIPNP